MNVLYIIGGEGNRYGAEIIATSLLSASKQNKINYIVITANNGIVTKTCNKLGIENYVIPFTFFVYKAMKNKALNLFKKAVWRCRAEYLTYRAVKFIEHSVKLEDIDIIHTNLSRDLLGGILAKKHNIPHVWHIHELYKTHYQLSFLRPNQLKWMSQHGEQFIAISKTVAKDWIQNGLPEDKVTIIYNGINSKVILKKDNYEPTQLLKLVMVGHLVPAKGQDMIIKKLSRLPNMIKKHISFDCIGDGTKEYKDYLLKLARESDIAVSLKGYCSEVENILKEYDIGLNCSRGEGFGLSTVEYMAAGLCPVVANTGANEEIIENKKNGFVFDYLDDTNFSELIEYLYSHRKELIKVSKQARADALLKYSIDNMQKTIFELYLSISKKTNNAFVHK